MERKVIDLSHYFSFSHYLPTYLPTYPPTYLPTYLPPTYLPTYLLTYLPTYLTYLPTYLAIYLSLSLSLVLSPHRATVTKHKLCSTFFQVAELQAALYFGIKDSNVPPGMVLGPGPRRKNGTTPLVGIRSDPNPSLGMDVRQDG